MRKVINLMAGTDPGGQGGIATVIKGLKGAGFLDEHNIRYLVTHSSKHQSRLPALLFFAKACLLLGYYLLFYRVGLIHLHMASRGSYTRKALLVRMAKAFGVKIIIHLHGGEFAEFYRKECSLKKQRHIRATFNLADRVIVLSRTWLTWVNSLLSGQNKAVVIYNAAVGQKAAATKARTLSILCLGRLAEKKGTGDLLRAYKKIVEQFPGSQLILGGDGDIDGYQQQAATLGLQDKVQFLGWVVGQEKSDWLATASVYVLPSYHEGFPMGIIEAMSAEVAIVASKAGGIPDAICHGHEGLLVDAGDIEGLADALALLLSQPELRSRYTQAAKQKYRQNFSPEIIFSQLNHLYLELLSDL
ncbi:glycosyltransferase family 4 protein [Thalassomonas haliotis]|uniref:Glycosyltransferase family 4 protein n=1 Tax=Thalassomonas haliotis TaxID=485448 RepID=A0ABY7VH62_9GAMM|nr:glycosyltransferase family 4 protein [Thalassomonas haliotis]WDE12786.1 glycosyltransferase family 4 protein [Thalassomonas haliotis]